MNMEAVKEMRRSMNDFQIDFSTAIIINKNTILHLGGTRTNALRAVKRWQKMGKEVKLLCP